MPDVAGEQLARHRAVGASNDGLLPVPADVTRRLCAIMGEGG